MVTFQRFLEPPRLRGAAEDRDRRATWLELFFDLVFVAAIAQVSYVLLGDLTLGGFLRYLGLFVPIWWAWVGFTFYANRFDTDDLPYRLLTLAAMIALGALAVSVRTALDGGATAFVVSYVGVRVVLIILYVRAWRHVVEARPLANLYLAAFGFAVCLWLLAIPFDAPWRYVCWAAALAVEVGVPILGWRVIPRTPIDPRHLPERFGLLTMIVLGESVFAVVVGTANVRWHVASAATAVAGFVVAAALWWIYFEFLDSGAVLGRSIARGLTFTYANYFVVVGLASLGVGVRLAVLAEGETRKYTGTGWVVCVGTALFMLGLAAVQLATPPSLLDTDVWLRLGTAGLAAVLATLTNEFSPLVITAVLAGALALQVAVELASHEGHGASTGPV